VWTADLERGEAFALSIEAGHTAVNGMTVSDPRLPFGGVKDSDYGRELSHHGLFEFVNFHTVVVNAADGPRADRRTASE
jgi:succinate-semialdehyde dehydrogenase/glutarate-semialdehyde dehydrogenase